MLPEKWESRAVVRSPASCPNLTHVKDDQHRFLALLGQPPARLTVEQAAWVLNCQLHDIPVLIAARLLRPLGNPPPNAVKFFATAEVVELSRDREWLAKVTKAVSQHWRQKNARKSSQQTYAPPRHSGTGEQLVVNWGA